MKKKKHSFTFLTFMLGATLIVSTTSMLASCSQVEEHEYVVHFETNCNTTIPDRIYNTKKKNEFTLPTSSELTKFGYKLLGWCYDEQLSNDVNPSNIIITSDTTLYAKWEAGKYQISFDTDTDEVIENMPISYGETVTLPTPKDKVIAGTGYKFKRWYYVANSSYHTDTFTLNYPQNVSLLAEYDYLVRSSYIIDEDGYYRIKSTLAITEISSMPLAYGTFSASITYDAFTANKGGFVWNATLDPDTESPWEGVSQFYVLHMNPSSGAIQLAYNDGLSLSTSYHVLKTVALSGLTENVKTKYTEAKEKNEPVTFDFSVTFSSTEIKIELDGETQIDYTGAFPVLKGLGVGFRANDKSIKFSNPKITPTHYQIDFDVDGGDPVDLIRIPVNTSVNDSEFTLPTPVKQGYEFLYWADENGTEYTGNEVVSTNITLKAVYEQIPGGTFVTYVTNNEDSVPVKFIRSGSTLGELPDVSKLGFDLTGWFMLDGDNEVAVNEDTTFVDSTYDGEATKVTIYAKWIKNSPEDEIEIDIRKGTYPVDTDYDGYTAYTASKNSFATIGTLSEGTFTTFIKFAPLNGNGLVIGGDLLDNFGYQCNADFMQTGSKYYYWHFNNGTGVYQFAKVTDPNNDLSTNITNPGYDVLYNGQIENFTAGSRHLLSVTTHYSSLTTRVFELSIDGEYISTVVDDGTIAGEVITGDYIGFRNQGGACTYYGIDLTRESEMDCTTVNLDIDGAVTTYSRHNGWELVLPTPVKDGYAFVGWTTVKDDVTTLVEDTIIMSDSLSGKTYYSYFIDSSKSLLIIDTNGGVSSQSIVIVDANSNLLSALEDPTKKGFKFVGWVDEEGNDITETTLADKLIFNLKAVWGAVSENILEIDAVNSSLKTTMKIDEDDVYKYYAMSSSTGFATFNDSFTFGSIKGFYKPKGAFSKGDYGIAFRGTNLATTTSSSNYSYYSCYTFRFKENTGGMELYDMGDSTGTAKATVLAPAVSWATKFPNTSFLDDIHSFEISFIENDAGGAAIKIYVDDVLIFDVTTTSVYAGTELGLRLTGNTASSSTGSFFGIHID
ncbi:MAG: InlB B-repeat-containing protein [Bacilli bacterium]